MGWMDFSFKTLIKMVFPIIYNEYPFFSAYMVLYCLIPFLNKLLHILKRGELLVLIAVLFLVISIIPTVFNTSWIMTETQLPAFILLYIIGAGIGEYGNELFFKRNFCQKLALPAFLIVLLMWISQIILHILIEKNPFYFVWDMNKTPVILAAIVVFMIFKDLQIKMRLWKFKNLIPLLSGSVFGVYLIHMNRNLKTILLDVWFDNTSTYGTWRLLPQVVGGAIVIFIGCSIVDIIRSKTVEKALERHVGWVSDRIEGTINRIIAKDSN